MRIVKICGDQYELESVFTHNLTVPDCVVDKDNKIGSAKGEKKFYISSKEGQRIQDLPLDEKRQEYLEYHRNNIFKKIGDE